VYIKLQSSSRIIQLWTALHMVGWVNNCYKYLTKLVAYVTCSHPKKKIVISFK